MQVLAAVNAHHSQPVVPLSHAFPHAKMRGFGNSELRSLNPELFVVPFVPHFPTRQNAGFCQNFAFLPFAFLLLRRKLLMAGFFSHLCPRRRTRWLTFALIFSL